MSFNLKISKASKSRSTFQFDCPHLQSSEFMQNNVIFCRNTVPTDHFKITPVIDARCAALTNPSFIHTRYFVRAFYVPYSVLWSRFDDWVNGNLTFIDGAHISNGVPTVGDYFLTDFLIRYSTLADTILYSSWFTTDHTHDYDFAVEVTEDSVKKVRCYKLNNAGRFFFKLFTSLGYKINFMADSSHEDRMNALPLLAYIKIFSDYFVPSVRKQISKCTQLLSYFYQIKNSDTSFENADVGELVRDALAELYHCYYPSSYLTSSWQSPVSPLNSPASAIVDDNTFNSAFNDIVTEDGTATNNVIRSTSLGPQINSANTPTANSFYAGNPWIQRNLQAVASWLLRSRFSGSDKLLNILARFGVKPKTPLEHVSRFCGSYVQDLNVQDINALAQTNGDSPADSVKVGEYAGKMFSIAQQSKTFDINCDDYGVIILTSMVAPAEITYYQGIDRDLLKTKPLQFFQPEFDSVGFEVLSRRELASGFTFPGYEYFYGNLGAGYVPRYSSYKVGSATVSGDFAVPTLNNGAGSFHHFRALVKYGLFRPLPAGSVQANRIVPNTGEKEDENSVAFGANLNGDITAQTSLLQTSYDKNQYNRIFNVTSDDVDHIFTMYHFNVVVSRPMRSIAESLPTFDETNDKVDVTKDVIENYK